MRLKEIHAGCVLAAAAGLVGAHSASPPEEPAPIASRFAIDERGALTIDGEPEFLFGLYHVSWIGGRTGQGLEDDFDVMTDAGFDVVHPTLLATETTDAVLSSSHERGVYVVGELYWPERELVVGRHRDAPAIVAWDLADDANWPAGAPRVSPEELASRRDAFRRLDPDALSYASVIAGPGLEVRGYAQAVDILGVQSYPIGNNAGDPAWDERALEQHVSYVRTASEDADGTGVCLHINLQTFAWPDQRAPTPSELRNMLYASIVHGYKGVLAYTFYDGNSGLHDEHPEVWEELRRLRAEVESLERLILKGERTVIDTGVDGLHGATWSHGDERLVIVLSTKRDHAVEFEVPLHEFAGVDGAAWRVREGVLSGRLEPEEVCVVRALVSGSEGSP